MAFLIDDDWDNDPRVIRAGTAAFGLYSRCGLWVARHLTDGYVPEELVADYGSREWAAKLVAAGLWVQAEGGYLMPDYLDRNPSRAQVEKRREQYNERQRKWRAQQEQRRLGTSTRKTRDKRVSSASSNAAPSPLSKERSGRAPAPPDAALARSNPPDVTGRRPDCPHHVGQPAHNCGPCRSERLAPQIGATP